MHSELDIQNKKVGSFGLGFSIGGLIYGIYLMDIKFMLSCIALFFVAIYILSLIQTR